MEKSRLLDQTRDARRLRHYSLRTEATYIQWIKRVILFHRKCHPSNLRKRDIWLAETQFGYSYRAKLVGHMDARTTTIYAHVLNHGGHGMVSW